MRYIKEGVTRAKSLSSLMKKKWPKLLPNLLLVSVLILIVALITIPIVGTNNNQKIEGAHSQIKSEGGVSNEISNEEGGDSQQADNNQNQGSNSEEGGGAPSPNSPEGQPRTDGTENKTQPAPKKITNWSVKIFQSNKNCGTSSNPCPWPAGLVISIVAVDNDNGQYIPLKDCSLTAGPVGFAYPGGSFSANPSVYSDGGVPVCGGGYDFSMGGHFRLGYEVWPSDNVNMDLKYKGGTLLDYYVGPR